MVINLLLILQLEFGRVRIDTPLSPRIHIVLRHVLELVTLLLLFFLEVFVLTHLLASISHLHIVAPTLVIEYWHSLFLRLLHEFFASLVYFGHALLVFVWLLLLLTVALNLLRHRMQSQARLSLRWLQAVE